MPWLGRLGMENFEKTLLDAARESSWMRADFPSAMILGEMMRRTISQLGRYRRSTLVGGALLVYRIDAALQPDEELVWQRALRTTDPDLRVVTNIRHHADGRDLGLDIMSDGAVDLDPGEDLRILNHTYVVRPPLAEKSASQY